MPDCIPGGDAEFSEWLDNFVTYANANPATLGLVPRGMTPMTTAQSTWKNPTGQTGSWSETATIGA
jgi:hypothetical protein